MYTPNPFQNQPEAQGKQRSPKRRSNARILCLLTVAIAAAGFYVVQHMHPRRQSAAAAHHALPPVVPDLNPVATGAAPVKVAGGFNSLSAITADGRGMFYLADQGNNAILTCTAAGGPATFIEPAGRASSLSFDYRGNLIVAAPQFHQVWQVDARRQVQVLADKYNNIPFNGPAGVWVRHDTAIMFSDPVLPMPWEAAPEARKPMEEFIHIIAPKRDDVRPQGRFLGKPTAMTGSPDGHTFFLADASTGRVNVFTCKGGGSNFFPTNPQLVCNVPATGLCLDSEGNLYTASPLGLDAWDRDNEHIAHWDLPCVGVAFGGPDNHLLGIATTDALYTLRMQTHGVGPILRPLAPEEIEALPPEQALTEALYCLAAGRQRDAEKSLDALAASHPTDIDLLFAHAVCVRSRFNIRGAAPLFAKVANLGPGTPYADAARLMLTIDGQRNRGDLPELINKTISAEDEDPLLLWTAAIACRTIGKPYEGCVYYRKLLERWTPGPSLVHQTFGNMLDEAGRHEEALLHRRTVVEMEPTGWGYQGLAISLASLYRYAEAEKAFAEAARIDPDYVLTWWTWANLLSKEGRIDESIGKCIQAIALDPACGEAYGIWGRGLELQGKEVEALEVYAQGIKKAPQSPLPLLKAADILDRRGSGELANKLRARAKQLNPGPVL